MEQSDSGGVGAKKGFLYQDYAAAYYLLKMLRDKSIVSIRCEVTDDIDVVYQDYVEHVQVKTTDAERKWSLKEFTEPTYKSVPPTGRQRKNQKVSNNDSILHKSMDCDSDTKKRCQFRILSPREVLKPLNFLKISFYTRSEKAGRNELLIQLQKKIADYKSPRGHDVEYWLDNTIWEVIPTIEQLELECQKMILQSAQSKGYMLSVDRDCDVILNSILNTLTKKSATSRITFSVKDKSYLREDFFDWFYSELEIIAKNSLNNVKIYTKNAIELQAVLKEFTSNLDIYADKSFVGDKNCSGLEGKYEMRRYRYDQIAKSIMQWLPEVLLTPSELADTRPENFDAKIKEYAKRIDKNIGSLSKMVAHVLLHSVIRTTTGSQPIPAYLYIDDGKETCFENVHIVIKDHSEDQLWMGFSYFVEDNFDNCITEIVDNFFDLLNSESFANKKTKILDVKEDRFLVSHDIDKLLLNTTSIDECLDSFRFVFFIGYETSHLTCKSKDLTSDYKDKIIDEVYKRFGALVDGLIDKDEFMEDLHIDVYLYPVPCVNSLLTSAQKEFEVN